MDLVFFCVYYIIFCLNLNKVMMKQLYTFLSSFYMTSWPNDELQYQFIFLFHFTLFFYQSVIRKGYNILLKNKNKLKDFHHPPSQAWRMKLIGGALAGSAPPFETFFMKCFLYMSPPPPLLKPKKKKKKKKVSDKVATYPPPPEMALREKSVRVFFWGLRANFEAGGAAVKKKHYVVPPPPFSNSWIRPWSQVSDEVNWNQVLT